jgi:hypothetical protein
MASNLRHLLLDPNHRSDLILLVDSEALPEQRLAVGGWVDLEAQRTDYRVAVAVAGIHLGEGVHYRFVSTAPVERCCMVRVRTLVEIFALP